MRQRDNWGARARIGMFIVSSEAVPEAEWWAMLPDGVSVHAARIKAGTPWAPWDAARSGVVLEGDLASGAEHFAGMRLSVAVIGHSSSSIVGGAGWDDAVMTALSGVVKPETQVTTNGRDCQAALKAMGVAKPFLVFPPWFNDATVEKGVAYFTDAGFAPAGHHRFDPGPDWRKVPFAEMYPRGLGFEQDIDALAAQIVAGCPDTADGVLIAGTGFRCVALIDDLEARLGRPVVTANQASLWRCLRLSDVADPIPNYGRLLRM
jgi:maleate isomerase